MRFFNIKIFIFCCLNVFLWISFFIVLILSCRLSKVVFRFINDLEILFIVFLCFWIEEIKVFSWRRTLLNFWLVIILKFWKCFEFMRLVFVFEIDCIFFFMLFMWFIIIFWNFILFLLWFFFLVRVWDILFVLVELIV